MDSKFTTKGTGERLTTDAWEQLPWLISMATVVQWTGLQRRDIYRLVREQRLQVFRTARKGKFYKHQIAELIRLPTRQAPTHRIAVNPCTLAPMAAHLGISMDVGSTAVEARGPTGG